MKQHLRNDKVALWSNLINKLQLPVDPDLHPSRHELLQRSDHDKQTTIKFQQNDRMPGLRQEINASKDHDPFIGLPKATLNVTKDPGFQSTNHKNNFASPRRLSPEEKLAEQLLKRDDLAQPIDLDLKVMQQGIDNASDTTQMTGSGEPGLSTILSSTALWVVVLIIALSFFNLFILGCICLQKWSKGMERRKQKRKYRSNGSLKLGGGMLANNVGEDAEDDETFSALRSYEVQQKEKFPNAEDQEGSTFSAAKQEQELQHSMRGSTIFGGLSLDVGYDRQSSIPAKNEEVKYVCDILSTVERKAAENKYRFFTCSTMPASSIERSSEKSVHFVDTPSLPRSSADRHTPKERIPIKLLPQRIPCRRAESSGGLSANRTIQKCLINISSDPDEPHRTASEAPSPSTVV